jgi:hypothetical protein
MVMINKMEATQREVAAIMSNRQVRVSALKQSHTVAGCNEAISPLLFFGL